MIQDVVGESVSAHRGVKKKGPLSTAAAICRDEGFFRLWQGIQPGLARHVIYTGVRMSVFEQLRDRMGITHKQGFSLHQKIVCGMTAGSIGQFIASPMDLIKVRMQAEGIQRLKCGSTVPSRTMRQVLKEALQQGGFFGLWKGCVPNVQRAALVNMGDLVGYGQVKGFLVNYCQMDPTQSLTHGLSSVGAGLVAATVGTPADVVKTRVMNQPVDENGKGKFYRGSVHCFVQTVKNEGFMTLYRGFIPIWLRMGPWSMTFWVSYEQLRLLFGMGTW